MTPEELRQRLAEVEAERDAYKRDFDAELDGNAQMRTRLGARESETMFAFVDRLTREARTEKCDKCGRAVHYRQVAIELQDGAPIDDPAGFQWCHACHCQRIIDGVKAEQERLEADHGDLRDALGRVFEMGDGVTHDAQILAAACDLKAEQERLREALKEALWRDIATADKSGATVLLKGSNWIRTGWWAVRVERWSVDSVVTLSEPTHWMPLPSHPLQVQR